MVCQCSVAIISVNFNRTSLLRRSLNFIYFCSGGSRFLLAVLVGYTEWTLPATFFQISRLGVCGRKSGQLTSIDLPCLVVPFEGSLWLSLVTR